ncbi:hypothetical protein K474DRAFT_1670365, partial [Panus rudis PR-1116 ss-1]
MANALGASGALFVNDDLDSDVQINYSDPLPSGMNRSVYYRVEDPVDQSRLCPMPFDLRVQMPETPLACPYSVTSSRPSDCSDQMKERDHGRCTVTLANNCTECRHIIPRVKGDEFIARLTSNRKRQENDVVENIDDIRNGLSLDVAPHTAFQKGQLGILRIPESLVELIDIDLSQLSWLDEFGNVKAEHTFDPSVNYIVHWLGEKYEGEYLWCNSCNGAVIARPEDRSQADQWPPAILFEAAYGYVVLEQFGSDGLREYIESVFPTNEEMIMGTKRTQAFPSASDLMNKERSVRKKRDKGRNSVSDVWYVFMARGFGGFGNHQQIMKRKAELERAYREEERKKLHQKVSQWLETS